MANSPSGSETAASACPKCQAPRPPEALECSSCGIIFAKWQARQEALIAGSGGRGRASSSGSGVIAIVAGVLIILGGTLAWWLIIGSKLAPNEILVTYEHGETCKWVDWSFRIRRDVSNNKARGNVLIVGPPNREVANDTTLRVFDSDGEKLVIARGNLREIEFTTAPDDNNSSNNQVLSVTIRTASDRHRIVAEELPRFSRSRALVPVASHYFPEQNDDYMSWGNVRATLAGNVEAGCSTDREISLTRPGHPKKRTPAHIEFAGA